MHDASRAQATAEEGDSLVRSFAAAPPLAFLAALAAVLHLLTYRIFVPVLAIHRPAVPGTLLSIGPFLLNLTACAGMVAWTLSTFAFVRTGSPLAPRDRVTVAALAGVLLTMLAIATFAPEARVPERLVLVGGFATHLVAMQMSRSGLAQPSAAAKATAGLITAAAVLSLVGLLAHELGAVTTTLLQLALGLGELAYLATPIAAAFVVVPWSESSRERRARNLGTLTAAAIGCGFAIATRLPPALYHHILFSTWRLEWALDKASLGYAVPISLASGAAVAALSSPWSRHRQGGMGILLWLSAGYNPLTPARMLCACLAVALLSRALLRTAPRALTVDR